MSKNGGILTGKEIEKEMENGRIIIHPYRGKIGPNSYDVSLGEYCWRMGGESDIYIISEEESVKKTWFPDKAITWEQAAQTLVSLDKIKQHEIEFIYSALEPNDLVILIEPGELILAHTQEFIGSFGNSPITTEMKARSSAGRSGITVCSCAGMGDPGYCTRWTMEIKNNGTKIIPLKVGYCLAQIVFISTVGEVESYTKNGNYQKDTNDNNNLAGENNSSFINKYIENMKNNWNPNMMLPNYSGFNM